jgi:hypothetical protein
VAALLRPAPGAPGTGSRRFESLAALTVLVIRACYCAYAVGVVSLNIHDFARPMLALAALLLVLCSSATLGILVRRGGAVSLPVAVADTAVTMVALIAMNAALAPGGAARSVNWALAYAVGCTIWLAFSRRLAPAAAMAAVLAVTYGVGAVSGVPRSDTALAVTAAVNAISLLIHFGTALVVCRLVRLLAQQTDEAQALQRRHRREMASLRERERLFADVHAPVAAVLDVVAAGTLPAVETRRRANAQALALRHALGTLDDPSGGVGLKARLAELAGVYARHGWRLVLVDDEITREPAPAVSDVVCSALVALLPEADATSARAPSVRVASDGDGVEVVVRLAGTARTHAATTARARAALASVNGRLERRAALRGEIRLAMRVPG